MIKFKATDSAFPFSLQDKTTGAYLAGEAGSLALAVKYSDDGGATWNSNATPASSVAEIGAGAYCLLADATDIIGNTDTLFIITSTNSLGNMVHLKTYTNDLDDLATVAAILSAQGITGVLQSLETLVESEVINITRGDAKTLTFSLGTGWNLTGRKAYLCIKKKRTDADGSAVVNRVITITDATNGVGEITLTTAETDYLGTYEAEIEVRDTDESNPNTALTFKINYVRDVRQGA